MIRISSFLKIIEKIYKFKLENEFRYDAESFMYEYESILEKDGVNKDELLEYINGNYNLDENNKDDLIDSIIFDTRLKINEIDIRLKTYYENSYDSDLSNTISEESLDDIVNLRKYYDGFLIGLCFCVEHLRNNMNKDNLDFVLDNLSFLKNKNLNLNLNSIYSTDIGMEKSIIFYLNLFKFI